MITTPNILENHELPARPKIFTVSDVAKGKTMVMIPNKMSPPLIQYSALLSKKKGARTIITRHKKRLKRKIILL